MTRIAVVVLLALAAGAAFAGSAPAASPPAAKPRLVCFTEPSTGSHIRKRTCVTEEEAAARRKRDQEAMRNMPQKVSPRAASPGS